MAAEPQPRVPWAVLTGLCARRGRRGHADGRPQHRVTHEDGTCRLFRTGDAVAHRNVHAALLDARRPCGSL